MLSALTVWLWIHKSTFAGLNNGSCRTTRMSISWTLNITDSLTCNPICLTQLVTKLISWFSKRVCIYIKVLNCSSNHLGDTPYNPENSIRKWSRITKNDMKTHRHLRCQEIMLPEEGKVRFQPSPTECIWRKLLPKAELRDFCWGWMGIPLLNTPLTSTEVAITCPRPLCNEFLLPSSLFVLGEAPAGVGR